MTDTVLRGTGNSRSLRSVSNFLTLYPSYNAFAQALVQGTLPIDLGALNSAGLTRRGTDLNKANILTDATATGMGLTASATPNQAFAKLRALIKAAQDDADTALENGISIQTGSYAGNGEKTLTIHFSHSWHLFVAYPDSGSGSPMIVFRGVIAVSFMDFTSYYPKLIKSTFDATDTQLVLEFGSMLDSFYPNELGRTYKWWAM